MPVSTNINCPIDVVVLASGLNQIVLFDGYIPGYKALIPYHGRASIQYVLDALEGVSAVRAICVEGPRTLLEPELAKRLAAQGSTLQLVEGGETFLDSLVIGLKFFASSPAVLFITADIPLVTAAAIHETLTAWERVPKEPPQSLFITAVPQTCYKGAYTHFTKPFNRYRDVSLCHGNLFIADPKLLQHQNLKERINRFYAGRKNAVTTTLALGWRLALVYLFGVELLHALTLKQMARFASQHLGFGVASLLVEHPEITIDVDEPDDYCFVRDRIEERSGKEQK